MLSKYVFKSHIENQSVLVNIVTKKILLDSADENLLKQYNFLEGQELEAINERLNIKQNSCKFIIIPTWECNLRCTHCVVLNKLVKKDIIKLDIPAIIDFIQRFKEYNNLSLVEIGFVGGEPLLHPEILNEIIDKLNGSDYIFSITTNLSVEFNDEIIKCLKRLKFIEVSLDGDLPENNQQRHALNKDFNPFIRTFNNLKQTVIYKIPVIVKAALKDEFLNIDHYKRYYKTLLKIGIPKDKIKIFSLHPTERDIVGEDSYHNFLKSNNIISSYCCKHRLNSYVINKNEVLSDYYDMCKLGYVYDSIDSIITNQLELTYKTLNYFTDENCNKCPVIGACWGGCTNGSTLKKDKPSQFCNQKALIERINSLAVNGELIPLINAKF